LKRVPTGILSLDETLGGGVPPGSLLLLVGEVGSGPQEFVLTSSVLLAAVRAGLLEAGEEQVVPERMWWITFGRQESDLREEVLSGFGQELYGEFDRWVRFRDLSESSLSPAEPDSLDLLDSLLRFLREEGRDSLIVLSELPNLLSQLRGSERGWRGLLLFLRRLQRESKGWGNGLIYVPLETGGGEEGLGELEACADGVFAFEWIRPGPYKRKRVMYLRRLRRLPSSLWGEAVFEVSFVPPMGLQLTKPELIKGG
jgi:KaiC/GvpD/RAD55 family RecA-like ATPase